jgi:hypothetical protein
VPIDLATVDLTALGLSRLPAYMQRQRWQELVTAIAEEVQELDDALVAMVAQLHLDTAVGAQLDLIGNEANEGRSGREDDEYRQAIRIRIAVHRSRGLAEEVLNLVRKVLDDADKTVVLANTGDASASLTVGGAGLTSDEAERLAAYAYEAVSDGIRLDVVTSTVADADTFRFVGVGIGSSPTLSLIGPTGAIFDTLLSALVLGAASNGAVTLAITADAGAPDDGEWATGFPAFDFRIKDGVTTIADFEAAVLADQSEYLAVQQPSSLPGPFVEFDSTFPAQAFTGAEDGAAEPGAGFTGDPAYLDLAPLLGSGYDTVAGLRLFGAAGETAGGVAAGDISLTFAPDAGAPNAGTLNEGGFPDIEFIFKPGVTTIADFEAATVASDLVCVVSPSTTSGVLADPADAFVTELFTAGAGDPGGQFASVQQP